MKKNISSIERVGVGKQDLTTVYRGEDGSREVFAMPIGALMHGDTSDNDAVTDLNNFAIGTGNKIGTKAFEIIGYQIVDPETPPYLSYYVLSNLDDDANHVYAAFSDLPDVIGKYVCLKVDYNIEHFAVVTGIAINPSDTSKLRLYVDRVYTNDESPNAYPGDTPYGARTADNGLIYNTYNLAWAIAHKDDDDPTTRVERGNRALFIEGAPEAGTFEYRGNSVTFGSGNVVQGDNSYIAGRENVSTGRYSSAFGVGNHVGYDDHALGRNNKMYRALDSFVVGMGNIVEDVSEPQAGADQLTSAVAIGFGNRVNAQHGIALGSYLRVTEEGMTAVGAYNDPQSGDALEVGGGTDGTHRKNLFAVRKDGTIIGSDGEPMLSFDQNGNLIVSIGGTKRTFAAMKGNLTLNQNGYTIFGSTSGYIRDIPVGDPIPHIQYDMYDFHHYELNGRTVENMEIGMTEVNTIFKHVEAGWTGIPLYRVSMIGGMTDTMYKVGYTDMVFTALNTDATPTYDEDGWHMHGRWVGMKVAFPTTQSSGTYHFVFEAKKVASGRYFGLNYNINSVAGSQKDLHELRTDFTTYDVKVKASDWGGLNYAFFYCNGSNYEEIIFKNFRIYEEVPQ